MANVKYLSSVFAIALSLTTWAATDAKAADWQRTKRQTIFDDTFKDGAGFEQDDQALFGPPGLQMTIAKTEDGWAYINNSADAVDGDYCAVAIMPPPIADDNGAAIGISVLYVDDDNVVSLYVFSDNTVQIERRVKGSDPTLILNEQNQAIKADVGTPVAVRAVVQGGTITAYVNGVAFKKVPVDIPANATTSAFMRV